MVRRLCADDVCRLKALGALEQVKLHGLTLVQSAVAVLLNRREVHEHIFSRRALDESISLRPVEPLHCSFLSHGKNSFHQSRRIILRILGSRLDRLKPPSEKPVEFFRLRPQRAEGITSKKKKTPQFPVAVSTGCGNSGVRHFGAVSTTQNKRQPNHWSHHRTNPRR